MTVEEFTKKYSISTSHLSRIFREHTGITLVEYITIRKVEESQYHFSFSEEKISGYRTNFTFVIKAISLVYSKNIQGKRHQDVFAII